MTDGYSFRLLTLTDDELERTSALLRLVFKGAANLTPAYLRWQYLDNPDGRAVGCNAWLGDELVGHMTAVPLLGALDGEHRPGLFMLNGAVHPAHQRRKLQSRISAAIFEESVRLGYAYCFGTGNRYSTKPLLTRFKMVKPLEARLGFGLPRRRDTAPPSSWQRIWSDAAMRWRLANPERTYADRSLPGRSLITAPAGRGIDAILTDAPEPWPAAAPAPRGSPLRIWLGLDPSIAWGRSTFVPIPQRLRPSPLNLVFKDLTGGNHVPDPDRVTFRAIDFDPY